MPISVSSTFLSNSGDGYELQMGRWSRRLAPRFIHFAALAGAAKVLDVGCGTGSLSFCLAGAPEIGNVHGIDLSPEYVAHATRKNRNRRLTFQVADACSLPFPDASFDHSLSLLVLQFIPRPELAIGEMRRVTRPGGTVAAATWDSRGGLVAQRIILDTAAVLDPNANEFRARTCTRALSRPGDLGRAWRDAGFADVVEDMLTIRMEFASFADFWTPAEGCDGPIAEYVRTLSPGARAALRERVRQAYLDGEIDGTRSYAATAWVVRARA
jgi:ubiquinone/menaquinone biosynthesis C-methylase UbiE